MEILILSIRGLGLLLLLAGGLWLLIRAFRQSVLRGLTVFLIPFAFLVLIVRFWTEARHPLVVSLVSLLLCLIGGFFGAMTAPPREAAGPSGSPR